jgi:hypothetical protein
VKTCGKQRFRRGEGSGKIRLIEIVGTYEIIARGTWKYLNKS